MKKEIENIIEIIGELKKIKLSRKYISLFASGKEMRLYEIEDMETYVVANEAYKKGKADELKKIQDEKQEEYTKLVRYNFLEIQNDLNVKFATTCIESVEAGKLEDVLERIKKIRDSIKIRTLKHQHDCRTYREETAYQEAKKANPIKTRLFGVDIEFLEDKNLLKTPLNVQKINIIQPTLTGGTNKKEEWTK